MLVDLRAIASIRPYAGNPRLNDAAVDAAAACVKAFGFRQPIVVDGDGVILVGHTRWKAAVKLGRTEVPVHAAEELTATQARAYRIADNQTATLAEWDDHKLVAELPALRDHDFDPALTGFGADDLAALLGDEKGAMTGDLDDAAAVPAEPTTRPGDAWMLGPHRLVCGAAAAEVVAKLLAGDAVDLLLTDPPYNVGYVGKTAAALVIDNDAMPEADYRRFLVAALAPAAAALKPGAGFHVWHADTFGGLFRAACEDVGLPLRQVLVWVKSTFALGRQDYYWQHEPCLYGRKEGAGRTWLGGRAQATILSFDKPARNAEQPTMKPVALFRRLIENSCPRGGVVLDPFGGSGTTLIAAQACGRVARLIELDPGYCDVIVLRWEQRTGGKPCREQGIKPIGVAE